MHHVHLIPSADKAAAFGDLVRWWETYLDDPLGALSQLWNGIHGLVFDNPIRSLLLVVGAIAVVGALADVRRRWLRHRHTGLSDGARTVTVRIPPQVDPAGGEALWSNLVGLLRPAWRRWWSGQPHLGFEYVFSETGVQLRLWVPGTVPPGLVERAVEAAWPGAHTVVDPARPPIPHAAGDQRDHRPQRRVVAAGQLRLARPEGLPIRHEFDTDPVRALLGAPSGLGPGEFACVQILARPVTGRRVQAARRTAQRLHGGSATPLSGRLLDALTAVITSTTSTLTATGAPRQHRRPSEGWQTNRQTSLEFAAQDRAVVAKQRGSQYETVIRYAVSITVSAPARDTALVASHYQDADDGTDARRMRAADDVARGRAHAIAATFAQYTDHNRYRRRRLRNAATVLDQRQLGSGDLLSIPELAALAHLPADDHAPGIDRAGAQSVPPPPGIAAPGPAVKPLGVSDRGHSRPVGLRVPDARHHLHVIGATGSGKSTLLGNMVLADADAGRGIVLIDAKGDLVTDVLARLPRRCGDRLVLLDADGRGRQPCLNPLDGGPTDLAVDNLVTIFQRVFAAWWGPRTDDIMRAACLTLRTGTAVATLADLPALLTQQSVRERYLPNVTDPVLQGFWRWYDDLSDASRAQVISPLMNKMRAFLLRPFVRDAIAGRPTTIDMAHVLDGGIFLVRIPKGSLGDETTRLIGSVVVAAAWQATTARAAIPQRDRRDASLVIDECHNFLNLPYPIEDMLAEARGFRVAMTLAHQHLGQLPRELRDGISTNARSKVYFAASPEDARDLARHTAPRLTEHDLSHLGAFHAAARLVCRGEETPPFTLRTEPLPPGVRGRSRDLRAAADAARARAEAELDDPETSAPPLTGSAASVTTSPGRDGDPRRIS
jgi:hypothetical protein